MRDRPRINEDTAYHAAASVGFFRSEVTRKVVKLYQGSWSPAFIPHVLRRRGFVQLTPYFMVFDEEFELEWRATGGGDEIAFGMLSDNFREFMAPPPIETIAQLNNELNRVRDFLGGWPGSREVFLENLKHAVRCDGKFLGKPVGFFGGLSRLGPHTMSGKHDSFLRRLGI